MLRLTKSVVHLHSTSKQDMKKLIGYKELSELTGYSMSTLYTLKSQGRIPFIKNSTFKRVRFDADEVMAIFREGHHKSIDQIVNASM